MKKLLVTLLLATMVLGVTACGTANEETSSSEEVVTSTETSVPEINTDTVGGKYLLAFSTAEASDASSIADELIGQYIFESDLIKMDVSEGYLDGFSQDITGFTKGVKFSPMIGAIPFVGYIFETDDPDALLEKLNSCADPAWNICTEADETVSMVKGNLVFFLMCTNEE